MLAAQIAEALFVEDDLWVRCASMGRIPYPFAYWGVQYLRKPTSQARAASLCLRCGVVLRGTRKRATPAVRCEDCAKEPPSTRVWPKHAVMPHTRGMWWLRRQTAGCATLFRGRAQAHHCESHRLARVKPSARVALRP